MVKKDAKKLARRLRAIGVVKKASVVLSHAGSSSLYVDIKMAYGHKGILSLLAKLMWKLIDSNMNCIAAGGYGGLPLAGALGEKYSMPIALVRQKPKTYARNVLIDGYVPQAGEKVWIVDDVFTTGESVLKMAKIIESTKAKVLGCSVVVRRTKKKIKIPTKHILTLEDLLDPQL